MWTWLHLVIHLEKNYINLYVGYDIWLKVLITEDRYEPALMYTGSTVL